LSAAPACALTWRLRLLRIALLFPQQLVRHDAAYTFGNPIAFFFNLIECARVARVPVLFLEKLI
jgi:hypothetical protein